MIEEIYRDDDFLVVNKPAGLLCVPGLSSSDNLFDRVKQQYPNARVVHRLDMATSGLVVFPLHYEAQKAMGRLFETRRVSKSYRAILHGVLTTSSGEVCLPLICDWEKRPKQKVCWRHGKLALTRFTVECVDVKKAETSVRLFPVTGRTHQLRVHMQALGHPIQGDALYSGAASEEISRLMLHAETLEFVQPLSQRPLTLQAPCSF